MSDPLLARIGSMEDEIVALTQGMVRIPTLNPPGAHYRDICEYLADYLRPHGFETELLRAHGTPGDSDRHPRWNLVATAGDASGPTVQFNGHTDVVEVGQGWTRDPWGGERIGDRIYGRGTCDMKGGLAAAIVAAIAYRAENPNHPGAIEITATADEETGGYGGVAWLAEQGRYAHVDHVIIPEPLQKDRICVGHRGVYWAEVETKGEIAHGSMPFLGRCAVRHMGAVLAEMERELWPALEKRKTEMPVVPEMARRSTMNVNSLHGGLPEPEEGFTGFPSAVVPDSARMVLDRRFLLEEPVEEVEREIRDLVARVAEARGFDYAIRELFRVHPSRTPEGDPVVTALESAVRDVLGAEAEHVVSPGTYDQKHVDRIGKLRSCVAYGPGLLELAHKPDEWIGVRDMVDSAKVMALALGRLLSR